MADIGKPQKRWRVFPLVEEPQRMPDQPEERRVPEKGEPLRQPERVKEPA